MGVNADVVIVGAGLIGASAALAIADAGGDVQCLTRSRPGAASEAAAGMLAPSMELAETGIANIAMAARDLFPAFVGQLCERTGMNIELNRAGLVQLAADAREGELLSDAVRKRGEWLEGDDIRSVEPGLVARNGAALWPDDGAVDSTQLLAALHAAIRHHRRVTVTESGAVSLAPTDDGISVVTDAGTRVQRSRAVIAAGAWSGQLRGARFAEAIQPVRGQLVEFGRQVLTHVVYGPDCYLVPRGGNTIAGSTMEWVGFDPRTTDDAVARLTAAAIALCPALEGASVRSWAGLRPVTPDLLPLLGPDPRQPTLIYACGHSRNGVLLTPLTANLLKEMIFEENLTFDTDRFRPERFAGTFTVT